MSGVDVPAWFRVDDRLIHGQVMVGWALVLGIRKIILANDTVAGDSWREEAFRILVDSFGEDIELQILPLSEVKDFLLSCTECEKVMLLVESLADAVELYKQGIETAELNLGGVHERSGRQKLLPYLYLDSEEMTTILRLSEQGVRVVARDLPGSQPVDVISLIKRKRSM